MEDEQGHWTETFEHESLSTPEAKTAFSGAMSKYATPEEAIIGGFNAQTALGKKLDNVIQRPGKDAKPEEIQAFHATLFKELGAVEKPEELKDLNWSVGMAEGVKPDEGLVASVTKLAVEKHWPKKSVQELVEFANGLGTQLRQQLKQQKQQEEQQELDAISAATEQLATLRGGEDKVKVDTEWLPGRQSELARIVPCPLQLVPRICPVAVLEG